MANQLHKTVSLGRKTVVFGLPWFTADQDEQPLKAANAFAKRATEKYDLAIIRKGEIQQFALGAAGDGLKSGSISAASIVAELAGTDSWLYVLEVGDDIWVCAGRDGYVLPDGDIVYSRLSEAEEAFSALVPSSFKKVYIPDAWQRRQNMGALEGVSGDTQTTNLDDFLTFDIPSWGKVTSLSSTVVILKASAIMAIAAIAIYGGYAFFNSGSGAYDPDEARRQMEAFEALQAQQAAEQQSQLDGNRPWASAPDAHEAAAGCINHIRDFPLTPVGYAITRVFCTPGSIDAEIERTTGYSTWLKEWAQAYDGLTVTVEPSGQKGFLSKQVETPSPRSNIELSEADTYETVSEGMFEVAQIEQAGLTMEPPIVEPHPDYPDYVPLFATANYQITTIRPHIWYETLEKHSGLTINAISYSLENQTYTLEGKLYVRNR